MTGVQFEIDFHMSEVKHYVGGGNDFFSISLVEHMKIF